MFSHKCVWLYEIPGFAARQALLSIGFPKPELLGELYFFPGIFPAG